MATLTRGTNYTGSVSQESISKTYTFSTASKYVDKNIALTVNVNKIVLANGQSFQIDDGLHVWTFTKDASGNVTIT